MQGVTLSGLRWPVGSLIFDVGEAPWTTVTGNQLTALGG
jgi:hypothetical protein